jgi:hypothetical protein
LFLLTTGHSPLFSDTQSIQVHDAQPTLAEPVARNYNIIRQWQPREASGTQITLAEPVAHNYNIVRQRHAAAE